ncbi:hypothetical protein HXZ88_17810, partial [Myroides odoratimimus]|nr:hypothetical protein [Myroides odoratimimus]
MENKFQLLKEQKFPENLEKKLISSITDKQVTTIWYGGVYDSSYDLEVFWLRVKDKVEATKVFSKKYTKELLEDNNYHIVLLDDNDFKLQDKAGRAFTQLCLDNTLLLYKDDNTELPRSYCYSSDVERFKQKYIETYNLLSSYSNSMNKDEEFGVSYFYLKFFEYDLGVIETMLFGTINVQCTLTERLLLLERVFPQIKTLFVKKEKNLYYIINAI